MAEAFVRSALARSLRGMALAPLAVTLACQGESELAPPDPSTPASVSSTGAPEDLSGLYQVFGRTVDKRTGDTRELLGTVVMNHEGDRFTAHFELKTQYPSEGGVIDADVIGDGEGVVRGSRLEGQATTQLVLGGVPGVDTAFAFVPRQVGPRIVNRTAGAVREDGTLELEVHSEAAAEGGQGYRPTRTTLTATRVPDADVD